MPFARFASISFISASGCSKLWKSVDVTFNYGLDGYMKTKSCIALFLFTFICSVSAADSKIEQAVRDQDAQWSKAAESRDVEKLLSFYADECRRLAGTRRDRDHKRFNSKYLSKVAVHPRRRSELEGNEGDGVWVGRSGLLNRSL